MKNINEYLENYVLNNDNMFEAKALSPDQKEKVKLSKQTGLSLWRTLHGKTPEQNGSQGAWAIDEPTDNDINSKIDKKSLDKNSKRLMMKLDSGDPFFIQGEAGWGKSSIIKSLAKRAGYTIITVYLDKAVKEDLDGIPVPVQGKSGAMQQLAPPAWVKVIEDMPDKDFLIFFDEMNQADPGVMNALMPIILDRVICGKKFDNFTVGCAGNFDYENSAVYELSGPLESRLKPIIKWESNTPETWKTAFKHLHEKWDSKLTPEIVTEFEDNCNLFDNPREIEHKALEWMYLLKAGGEENYDYIDADEYLWQLEGISKKELSRSDKNSLKELADSMYEYMHSKPAEPSKSGDKPRSSRADLSMIPEELRNMIRDGIKNGYVVDNSDPKRPKYGVSRQNIGALVEDPSVNAEMLEMFINKLEAEGLTFKFEKDSEWKKAGYLDALANG